MNRDILDAVLDDRAVLGVDLTCEMVTVIGRITVTDGEFFAIDGGGGISKKNWLYRKYFTLLREHRKDSQISMSADHSCMTYRRYSPAMITVTNTITDTVP